MFSLGNQDEGFGVWGSGFFKGLALRVVLMV